MMCFVLFARMKKWKPWIFWRSGGSLRTCSRQKRQGCQGATNCSSISKEREAEEGVYQKGSRLMRQPSDPTVLEIASEVHCIEMKEDKKRVCGGSGRRSRLLRTPSLPPSIGREEKFRVSDPGNGRSSKQSSSPTHSVILHPKQTSKVLLLSSSAFLLKRDEIDAHSFFMLHSNA